MAGIRVLVCTLLVFVFHRATSELRMGNDPDEAELKITLPVNWRVPEKFLPVLEPLFEGTHSLHTQKIKVRYRPIKTTMAIRPTFFSLFGARDRRTYVLTINNNSAFNGVLYQDVPPLARTGLWAHEMMHIRDYKNRKLFGVLFRGWQYLSKRGKVNFEREIDQMVIEAGFGEYLFEWTRFVLEESQASPQYKAYKREIYLLPCEISGDCDAPQWDGAAVIP